MKKMIFSMFLLFAVPAFAGPPSVLGGKPIETGSAHSVQFGWPSLGYEWWNAGRPDWAIGAELVYGDWSGEFSDVDIGFALNVPLRWHIHHQDRLDIGFLFKPGGMIGTIDTPGDNITVAGIRAEMGIPMTIGLNDQVNIITGAVMPFTFIFVEGPGDHVVIPILVRLGVEFAAAHNIVPSLVMEAGPTIAINDSDTEVELGLRFWAGVTFW